MRLITNHQIEESVTTKNILIMHHMDEDDFKLIRGWCINEGWNLGLHDTSTYYQTDPTGHLIFLINNTPIGSISLVKHSDIFFTVGPFIVKKEYRGMGYGNKIWAEAFEKLKNNPDASILLYAVHAQIHRYAKLGFHQKFINQRWQLNNKIPPLNQHQFHCKPIDKTLLNKIDQYDQGVFSVSRKTAFQEILNQPNTQGFVIQDDNQVKGFGIIRPCIEGYRIGPLIADTLDIAKCLLSVLINNLNGEKVIMDMPNINQQGNELMLFFNATRVCEHDTVAMLRGKPNHIMMTNINRHYAIFSLEIG